MSSALKINHVEKIGHWEIQADTGELYWSDEVYRIHGLEVGDEIDVEAAINAYHPDDRDMVIEYVRRALEEKEDYQFELRLVRPDGEICHVKSTGVVRLKPDGEVQSVFGIFQDITKTLETQKELQRYRISLEEIVDERTRELRQSEKQFRSIFNNAQAGIGRSRFSDGKVIEANAKLASIFGFENVDNFISDFTFSDHFVLPDGREKLLANIEKYPDQVNEVEFFRKDGSVVIISAYGRIFRDENYIDIVLLDITEKKKAEDRMRLFLENVHEGVFLIQEGTIIDVSSIGASMLGYTIDEIIGMSPIELVVPRMRDFVASKIADNDIEFYEPELLRKDGTSFPALVKGQSSLLAGENIRITTVLDITEQKRQEAALRESDARFKDFAEAASDWFWETDSDLKFTYFSGRLQELTGIDPNIYLGKRRQDVNAVRDDQEKWSAHYKNLDEHKSFRDFGYTIKWAQPRHIKISGTPVFDLDGTFQGYRGTGSEITSEIEAEKAHRASEQRFKDFSNVASDWFWEMDVDNRFSFISERFEEYTGMQPDQLLGKTRAETRPPGIDDGAWETLLEDIAAHRIFRNVIHSRLKPDGTEIWVSISGMPVFDKSNNFEGYRGTGREITSEIKASNEIRRSQERLSFHLENTPLASISWDKNFDCIEWNPAAERIFGFSKTEVIGKNAKTLIIPEEIHNLIDQVFYALLNQSGGNHSINENVTKDGRKIICEWFNTPLIGDDGIPFGVSSFAQDITEAKHAEYKLKESEETFRSFYEVIPDVFMVTSLETGLCVDVNNGFCQTTGYSRDDVIGKNTTDLNLWEIEEDRGKLVSGLNKDGIVSNLEATFRGKDGFLWPGIMSACIVQMNGQPHIISSTKDISDIRRSQLEAIEANHAKSEFLSSMSHELRTPMNAILGFAQLLQFNPKEPLSETQKSSVDLILRGGNHLLELIEQVLEFSKIEAGHLSLNVDYTPARDVIDHSLNLIQERADREGIKIIDQIDRDALPVLWTDSTRLTQVLLNVLSNAVKYNRRNGTVTLTCQELPGQMLRISVVDTGMGIPTEKQDDLFKPFERLGLETGAIEGTGIGLTITRQIIEVLGGQIGFESEVGKGSTFWIDVPMNEKEDTGIANVKMATSSGKVIMELDETTRYTILNVEDNPANMQLMEMLIGRFANTRLLTAYNAELALELARNEHPDLILMDINLPGMNGIEALQQLQNTPETKDIPVIAITAAAMVKDIEAGLKAGFRDYITKPIDVPKFIETIEEALDSINRIGTG